MNTYMMIAMAGSAVVCPLALVVMNTTGTTQKVFLGIQVSLLVGQITCLVIGLLQ